MKYQIRKLILISSIILSISIISGCSAHRSKAVSIKGDVTGNEYIIDTFDNNGDLTLKTHGQKISISPNVVIDRVWNSQGEWEETKTESAVITLNIDGSEIETCGDTCIFYDKSLEPDYDFSVNIIDSASNNILDSPFMSKSINKVKNQFGKSRVVIIKSQLGNPIYAFSGDNIYWEIDKNLPKFTRILVDEKPLYIHRANFQIIDTNLIDDLK